MARYALIDPTTGNILSERSFEKVLEPGTFNDEAAAAKNGKPFLLPIEPAVIPKGEKVTSTSLEVQDGKVVETAVTEPIPPPRHAVDGALLRPEYRALVVELAKVANKTFGEMVAALKA